MSFSLHFQIVEPGRRNGAGSLPALCIRLIVFVLHPSAAAKVVIV